MSKKVALLAVNPVNGMGLFQYLEAFFENGISYKTFAVADCTTIKSNSGITLIVDDVIANLKGKEDEFDAVVFACGDAVPTLYDNMDKAYNQDLLDVFKAFASKGKLMIGHCAAGMLFDGLGLVDGRKIAVHPYIEQNKDKVIKKAVVTGAQKEVDGNFYTAQSENTIWTMMPEVLSALK